MNVRAILLVILAMTGLFALTACGGGSKVDVPIFIMGENGTPTELTDAMQQSLTAELGDQLSFDISSSPIFSMDKLVVEIAAGDNGLLILPKQQFDVFVKKQAAAVSLDDLGVKDQFPDMVIANPDTKEKHLYGIPVSKLPWLTNVGYHGSELDAFIPVNFKNPDKAKEALKAILAIK